MKNLKKLLSHKDHPNIIFYNYNDISIIIKNISNKNVEKVIYEDITFYKNDDYFLFDTNFISKNKINSFKKLILDITNKYNIFLKKYYIIIENIDNNKKLQSILFSFTERNSNKFIFFCKNINSICKNMKNICVNINCKCVQKKSTNLNIISDNYFNNIFSNKLLLKNIKELSYILCCLNIPFNILFQHFVCCIIDIFEITYDKKIKCIKFISDLQYKYSSSFNKCIYYEYFLIHIYNILFIT